MNDDLRRLAEWGRAVAEVTPCACSAQRARAERAEATIARVRALADDTEGGTWPGGSDPLTREQAVVAAALIRAALDGDQP